ncbi:MAG: AMP-binding protein [Prevotellaceae bacterium]|jgi:long-chain acyl-CoA synthetase|nr:AMP-binding protein [Prevotellaceae bacterium]
MTKQSFLYDLEQSLKNNWDLPALTDYKGKTYYYKDVAEKIARLHILFEACGLRKGDKVSIVARNLSNWGITFLATVSYGAVAVPILHEFKADNVHHIVNHSESKILFAGDITWENLNEEMMPKLDVIVILNDFSIVKAKDKNVQKAHQFIDKKFSKCYPENFGKEHIEYHKDKPEELAVINYTSGTTGFSKGVMLPFRSLWANIEFARKALKELQPGDTIVSMLPMAHMYGLSFEFLYELQQGCHIYFLTRMPTPKVILEAFAEIKPRLVISVPLIIEKIYKKQLQPILNKPFIKLMMRLPIIDQRICKKINAKLTEAFGGKFFEIIIGGAAFNPEVETFLKKIGFRYTMGYGMTECAPIITYDDWKTNRLFSCGKAVPRMEVKIDSPDPENVVGEILTRGMNTMLGYYKNSEATEAILDKDGWLHTGDLAIMDKDGYIYIKGRSKNLILGPSGQNIYPEEIEARINNMKYVTESLIIESEGKLIALIYPDYEQTDNDKLDTEGIEKAMEENRKQINELLPQYSQIAQVKIYPEEFEKTPKKSIKRFMYQT